MLRGVPGEAPRTRSLLRDGPWALGPQPRRLSALLFPALRCCLLVYFIIIIIIITTLFFSILQNEKSGNAAWLPLAFFSVFFYCKHFFLNESRGEKISMQI